MRLFGMEITRATNTKALTSVSEHRGGWWRVMESFTGAWQQNVEVDRNSVLSYHAVYACMTIIASDISKLRVKLVERSGAGIWTETESSSFSPVLRKPNAFQNRIQFWESWILSKLSRGNTYILKQRDARGIVVALYVLDPDRVRPLIADDGSVFYELLHDDLNRVEDQIIVPAREIIHDRFNCLFHPLIGSSPIFASGLAATQGLKIQNNSAVFFGNRSMPGGIITAPLAIPDTAAARLKDLWDTNYSGANFGKVAVLGDGLTFQPIAITAVDAQLIEQLKWTAEVVCSVFHVPPYKIGIGAMPTYNNIQALNVEYYSQCLQSLIEAAELCLDEGLGLNTTKDGGKVLGTEFDLDGLLRMDTVTQMQSIKEAIGAGFMAPNEGRRKVDLPPVEGGDSPYLQEQNFSLAALSRRDATEDPWKNRSDRQAPPDDTDRTDEPEEDADDDAVERLAAQFLIEKRQHERIAA